MTSPSGDSPSNGALSEACRDFGTRLQSTSQGVREFIHREVVAATSKSANQLGTQLRMFETLVNNQLQKSLDECNATAISDYTQETISSAFSTATDIITHIEDELLTTLGGDPVSLLPSTSSSLVESQQAIQNCIRMVATQCQIFSFVNQLLSLNRPEDQDSVLETSENLKVLLRGSRDADMIRRRRDSLPTRSRRHGSYDMGKGRASFITTDLSPTTTKSSLDSSLSPLGDSRIAPDSIVSASSASSHASVSGAAAANSEPPSQPSSSISRLFGALKVGGASIARKSGSLTADQKFAFSHLCQACRDGDLEWARYQITQVGVADINATDSRRLSPLHYAVMQGNLEVVKLLVKGGARVGGRDGQSSAIVYLAVRKNNIPVLRYLLEEESAPVFSACCDSSDRSTFRTPLSLAVQNGQLEAVELLVKHGADVQGTDDLTLLCAAVDRGDLAMVKLLLQCDAPINETKSTTEWGSQLAALHMAAYKGHGEMVEILLERDAEISVTCKRVLEGAGSPVAGVTALHLAKGPCAGILLRHGAKVFARDSSGKFPLSGAVLICDIESVRTLLQNGAPVNAQDRKGDTALHIVCRMFAREVTRISTSELGYSGETTFENLTCHGKIAEELVHRGANVGSRAAARRIIRSECDKVLRKKPAEEFGRLQLMELMKFIVDTIKDENAAAETAADSGGKKAGIASISVQDLLAHTTLAHLVTR